MFGLEKKRFQVVMIFVFKYLNDCHVKGRAVLFNVASGDKKQWD